LTRPAVYDRLTEFKRGPPRYSGLANWDIADAARRSLPPAQGRKFQASRIRADRDFKRRRRSVLDQSGVERGQRTSRSPGGKYDYFNDMDNPASIESVTKTRLHLVLS